VTDEWSINGLFQSDLEVGFFCAITLYSSEYQGPGEYWYGLPEKDDIDATFVRELGVSVGT